MWRQWKVSDLKNNFLIVLTIYPNLFMFFKNSTPKSLLTSSPNPTFSTEDDPIPIISFCSVFLIKSVRESDDKFVSLAFKFDLDPFSIPRLGGLGGTGGSV